MMRERAARCAVARQPPLAHAGYSSTSAWSIFRKVGSSTLRSEGVILRYLRVALSVKDPAVPPSSSHRAISASWLKSPPLSMMTIS
jgi:hypothetical protein